MRKNSSILNFKEMHDSFPAFLPELFVLLYIPKNVPFQKFLFQQTVSWNAVLGNAAFPSWIKRFWLIFRYLKAAWSEEELPLILPIS